MGTLADNTKAHSIFTPGLGDPFETAARFTMGVGGALPGDIGVRFLTNQEQWELAAGRVPEVEFECQAADLGRHGRVYVKRYGTQVNYSHLGPGLTQAHEIPHQFRQRFR